MDTHLFVKALGGLFAIMNPFVALPMFLTLTAAYDAARQRHVAVGVAAYSLLVSAVVLVAGSSILRFFGVRVDDFRIAGGVVLMTIGLGLLHGTSAALTGNRDERAHQQKQAEQASVAFYPLAFPMIVGPGTITALIVFGGQAQGVGGHLAVASATTLVIGTLGVVLWFAPTIGHHLSQTLRTIMARLMGMILAAIAVEMIVTGLRHTFPGLAG